MAGVRTTVTIGLGVRERHVERLANERFDVAVVGGGITGAGIALDLAARGRSVALVERGDFASGTSSRSSKLIHGGLRYLAQLQFGVTRESLHERHVLQRLAPDLVKPLPFVIPVSGGLWEAARIAVGLSLYDLLAGAENTRPFWHLAPEKLHRLAPGLSTRGITTAFVYHDCVTDDAALTLAVLACAVHHGAAVVNHVAVQSLGEATGSDRTLALRDAVAGAPLELRARQIVLATGPWGDRDLAAGTSALPVTPSKGSHILFDHARLPVRVAFYLPGDDGRLIFVVPWQRRTLVGTTDTPHVGDLSRPRVDEPDLAYLLGVLRRHFPTLDLTESDVVGAQAGLRPLVDVQGPSSRASREETIWERPDGVIVVAGGKLTTYRLTAKRVADRVAARLRILSPSTTDRIPIADSARREAVEQRCAAIARGRAQLLSPLVDGYDASGVTVVDAVRHEQAREIDDVLSRRTRLMLLDHRAAVAAAPRVSRIMARELAWSSTRLRDAVAEFRRAAMQYGLPSWRDDAEGAA